MQGVFPNEQTRRTIVTAIRAGKKVAWYFGDYLIGWNGSKINLVAQGAYAAYQLPPTAYDYFVNGGTTGLAATAGNNSTDVGDDAEAQAVIGGN